MSSIVITIPKNIKWSDYEKELSAVEDESQEMHYKIPTLPKDVNVGDRCYLCHDGYIKGWMKISHIGKLDGFECTTTGKDWSEGYYVSRTGPFHYLKNPIPMKGFMGYRKIDDSAINEETNMGDKIARIVEQATRLVLEDRGSKNPSQARSYLENIIAEAINESNTGTLTLYRGYDKTKGNHNLKSGIWLTPQEEYAKVYARQFGDNGWVAEYTLDKGKLKVMDEATAQRIITDLYEPIEDDINDVFDEGKNAYEFEVNSYDADVLCLLSEEPIISIRDLSQEEFNAIPDEKEQVPKRDTALDNAVERNKGDYATRFKLAADLTSRGWLIHGTNSDFEAFDINKIRGGFRAHEGYGFYFTDMPYKGIDYGSNLKLVRKADFNFLNSKTVIRENNRLYYLFFHALDYLQYELNKANDRLMNVRNNREYDETNAEIENIKSEMAEMDEDVLTVAKSVINQIGSGCTVGQLEYNIPVNYIPRLVAQYVKLGYDGYETDGIYTIFNFEKLNEKFTTLDRIANNEGMEHLKNIVSEALADYVEERGDTVIIDNERKNVLYIGVKLDLNSKHTLMNIGEWFVKEKLGWSNYKIFCDHMTIAFRAAITDEIWQWFQDNKGMEDELTVFSFGFSDKACAVEVICHSPSQNQHKHITIATNLDNGGKPVDSNSITNWTPINEFRLKGTISEWTR